MVVLAGSASETVAGLVSAAAVLVDATAPIESVVMTAEIVV